MRCVPREITGRSLTYDDEDRLITVGGVVYEHDEDGFLKKKTDGSDVTEYVYSSRGELLRVDLPDGTVIEYVHDPLGRRIAKKMNGIVTEKYLWQGLTRLLAVYNADDTLRMRFEYADARMPVAMTKGGATYYLGYDQVGTLKAVADASGNVVKRIEYDTFGNVLSDSNAAFAMPFGFAGGLLDRDTGLVRFGYRDYDPETGRWTAKDPIRFAGGDTDLYGYCLNDPVNNKDDTGLVLSPLARRAIAFFHKLFQGSVDKGCPPFLNEVYTRVKSLFDRGEYREAVKSLAYHNRELLNDAYNMCMDTCQNDHSACGADDRFRQCNSKCMEKYLSGLESFVWPFEKMLSQL